MTDEWLRLLGPNGATIPGVFALGDCATIRGAELPRTAQVANQQSNYLTKVFNKLISVTHGNRASFAPNMYGPIDPAAYTEKESTVPKDKIANAVTKVAADDVVANAYKPFVYHHHGSMAYLGGWRAVFDYRNLPERSRQGPLAWFLWRSAYLTMTVSYKNRILIPMFWFLTWVFGREISRFQ